MIVKNRFLSKLKPTLDNIATLLRLRSGQACSVKAKGAYRNPILSEMLEGPNWLLQFLNSSLFNQKEFPEALPRG